MSTIPLFWLNLTIASLLTSATLPPPPPSEPANSTNIMFVGDIMVGRYVETLMNTSGEDYPFEKIDELLQGHDIVIGNLEGPIPTMHSQTPNNVMVFSFKESTAALLKNHYFTDVVLANNHTFDKGEANFLHTVEVVKAAGLGVIGHPTTVDEAYVERKTVSGKDLTFMGLHDATRRVDDAAAEDLLKRLAAEEPDLLIVTIHWGNEYQLHSGLRQQELAHMFVDAGADVVVGHHPHVTQEIELYNNSVIFYSLGNFIFDQYFSTDTQQGLAVKLEVADEQLTYQLYPLESRMSQPSVMTPNLASTWLEALAKRSSSELQQPIIDGKIEIPLVY